MIGSDHDLRVVAEIKAIEPIGFRRREVGCMPIVLDVGIVGDDQDECEGAAAAQIRPATTDRCAGGQEAPTAPDNVGAVPQDKAIPFPHRMGGPSARIAKWKEFHNEARIELGILASSSAFRIATLVRKDTRLADPIIVGSVIVAVDPEFGSISFKYVGEIGGESGR